MSHPERAISNVRTGIKIVRVIARLNVGGPAVHCLTLSSELSTHGYETILVTGSCEPDETDYEDLFPMSHGKYRRIRLPYLKRSLSLTGDFLSFFQLTWILIRERPHIVHTHTAKAGVLGRLAAFFARVPVVIHTFHGHVLSGYFSKRKSQIVQISEWALAFLSTRLITLSEALRVELALQYKIAPLNKFEIVSLGRDLTPFDSVPELKHRLKSELSLPQDISVIGIVGRLVPIKDHSLFLKSLTLLKTQREWIALIVGAGELKSKLEQEAHQLNLHTKVKFLGWRSDLASIYAALDVLVCTSKNEGTPLSIIEAFASGCPVISTRVGGVESLFHLENGRVTEGALLPYGDAEGIARETDYFLDHPEFRARAGQSAKLTAKHYSKERLIEQINGLYRKLLEQVSA